VQVQELFLQVADVCSDIGRKISVRRFFNIIKRNVGSGKIDLSAIESRCVLTPQTQMLLLFGSFGSRNLYMHCFSAYQQRKFRAIKIRHQSEQVNVQSSEETRQLSATTTEYTDESFWKNQRHSRKKRIEVQERKRLSWNLMFLNFCVPPSSALKVKNNILINANFKCMMTGLLEMV